MNNAKENNIENNCQGEVPVQVLARGMSKYHMNFISAVY